VQRTLTASLTREFLYSSYSTVKSLHLYRTLKGREKGRGSPTKAGTTGFPKEKNIYISAGFNKQILNYCSY